MNIKFISIDQFILSLPDISVSKSIGIVKATGRVLRIAGSMGVSSTADLTPVFLDHFVANLGERPLSDITKQYYMYCLSNACETAVLNGNLAVSPFDSRPELKPRPLLKRKLTAKKREGFKSPVQFRTVMSFLESRAAESLHGHRLFALAAVIAYTGASHYDSIMLRPEDVDLKAETIRFTHRNRRVTKPMLVPLPDELVRILGEWLKRTFQPLSHRRKLDDDQVAEVRRLRAEGCKLKDLAGRFGIGVPGISLILTGKNQSHVPKEGEVAKKIADLDWLFPVGKKGAIVPWKNFNQGRGQRDLKEAGKAAGVDNLTLPDLRYIYKSLIVPALVTLKPDQSAPLAQVSPVLLGSPTTKPMVLGRLMPVISFSEFNVVRALLNAYPDGLSDRELDERSGHNHSRAILQKLRKKDPDYWGAVIHFPGKNGRGGYKIGHMRTEPDSP